MKKTSRVILAMAAVLAFAGAAQAVTFTVGDIILNNLHGANRGFTWDVEAVRTVSNFDLSAGQSHTFTYGKFTTNDFSLDTNDVAPQTDYFTASFKVTPPTSGATFSDEGYVDAIKTVIPAVTEQYTVPAYCSKNNYSTRSECRQHGGTWHPPTTATRIVTPSKTDEYALVNYDNIVEQLFGNTGKYILTFNDLTGITHNTKCHESYDLTATIALLSDITPEIPPNNAPVPEPGTIVLLGTGLAGLGLYGRRRAKK